MSYEPYFVDVDVPDAVLLRSPDEIPAKAIVAGPKKHPNQCDAIWYAGASLCGDPDGVAINWSPENGVGLPATPSKPNEANGKLATDGGLICLSGVNCGLVVENALVDATHYSCAIRVQSPRQDARTLITVNPSGHKNYLFLQENEGMLTLKDQNETLELKLVSPAASMWVVMGYSLGRISLTAVSGSGRFGDNLVHSPVSMDLAASMLGTSDMFFGCRSHRKGILKTLGEMTLQDVLFWFDQDCLASDQGVAGLEQACRYVELQGDEA